MSQTKAVKQVQSVLPEIKLVVEKLKGGYDPLTLSTEVKKIKESLGFVAGVPTSIKLSKYEKDTPEKASLRLAKQALQLAEILPEGTVLQKFDSMGRPKLTLQDLHNAKFKNQEQQALLVKRVTRNVELLERLV